jgi:hypothetical protein
MNLVEVICSLVTQQKKIDVKHLPSQGLFYPKDFEISIKKADISDIIEYEQKYDSENGYLLIENIKRVVKNNLVFNKDFSHEYIKSVDIVYIFLEIVKWTQNKEIKIPYFDDNSGKVEFVDFDNTTFNYFDYSPYQNDYDSETREFLMDGYRVSLPSIGLENSLTSYLISKSNDPNADKFNHYSYDFLYFLGNKNKLTFNEIDNLITIFNEDLEESELKKIARIVKRFTNLIKYSIKKDGRLIDLKSKIDLKNIWKENN